LWTAACLAAAAAAQLPEGYALARTGDFVWLEGAQGHTTAAIRSLEPGIEFVFVESAHFRIACSLAPIQRSGPEDRERLQADVAALRHLDPKFARSPGIESSARAQIYALRLERLYADVARRLGVTDADFAAASRQREDPAYLGEGPHFGMRQRFLVMLSERESSLERYCATFVGRRVTKDGLRHFFREPGAQFLCIAAQGQHTRFASDRGLHAAVVYGATHALLDAFKYSWHETPLWLQEGFAHWQRRWVDQDAELFTFLPTGLPEKNRALDWPSSARLRVLQGNFTPLRDAITWLEDQTIDYGDHIAVWSRIDFLLRKHPAAFGKLMRAIKGPQRTGPSYGPTPEQVVAREVGALHDVFGWTPDEFDAAWTAFVKDTYPRR